jgi:hypothetical protein
MVELSADQWVDEDGTAASFSECACFMLFATGELSGSVNTWR